MIDFDANGDLFVFEGHANESPNDIEASPTNMMGIARVIHLDKNGKFINQFYGNSTGPGKFYQTHGSAIEPETGNVWIGDREEYRIVIYDRTGTFIRTRFEERLLSDAFGENFREWKMRVPGLIPFLKRR